jgi:hypothetical protein
MGVSRRAVSDDLAENLCVALPGVLESFKRHHCRAFTKRQSITIRVEGTAARGR